LALIGFVFSPEPAGKTSYLLVSKELTPILMFLKLALFSLKVMELLVIFPLILLLFLLFSRISDIIKSEILILRPCSGQVSKSETISKYK